MYTDRPVLVHSDWLFVGSRESSRNDVAISELGITHIFSCIGPLPPMMWCPHLKVEYENVDFEDSEDEELAPYIIKCTPYLRKRHEEGNKVLVHCQGGISRSVSLIIAYLITDQSLTFSEALLQIRQSRDQADPNPGFVTQLRALEKRVRE